MCKQVITAVGCHAVNYPLRHVALSKLLKQTTPGCFVSVLTIEFLIVHFYNKTESRHRAFL